VLSLFSDAVSASYVLFQSNHKVMAHTGPVSVDLQGPVMPRKLAPHELAKNALKLMGNPEFFCMA
jgi:hypothetical protein